MKKGKWVSLSQLNISEAKWPKFRKLKLPVKIPKHPQVWFTKSGIINQNQEFRVGKLRPYGEVNIVPVKTPQLWFVLSIESCKVWVTEDDLVALGCIVLSGES